MTRSAAALSLLLVALCADAAPVQIDPLPRQFIEPGCGCTFRTSSRQRQDAVVLRWAYADRRHAMMKLDGEVRRLSLVQEKRLPHARIQQGYGERLVLIFTDDVYRVEVPSSVTNSCAPGMPSCGPTRYQARLIVRRRAEAPRVVDGSGVCGC
jgi:hypothetical protein